MIGCMSEGLVFDSYRFVKDLVIAGLDESVAATLAEKQLELLDRNLATRADLAAIHERIVELEANLRTALADTRASLVRWTVSSVAAAAAVVSALVAAFS